MINREVNLSKCSIQELKSSVKEINTSILILSNQSFSDKLCTGIAQSVLLAIDFLVVKFFNDQNLFQQEKQNYGIGWGIFLGSSLIGTHLILKFFGHESLFVSFLDGYLRTQINDTANKFGVDLSNNSYNQLKNFEKKKLGLEKLISERVTDYKAFYRFSIYNHSHRWINKDVSYCIESFLFPRK